MQRRSFLAAAAGAAASSVASAQGASPTSTSMPVIDTHVHLFDTNRPQGVPWPPKENKALYMPALPDRYRKLALKHGVVGIIKVEASPWMEDNQWVLDLAAKDPLILGVVGNLGEPGQADFAKGLERFRRNPLFRGVRYGNLWGSDLAETVTRRELIADLKLLADADLSFDTANPNPALVAAVVQVTDRVPNLRVVVDHLPSLVIPERASERRVYETHLSELARRPQVFVKLSQIFRKRADGQTVKDFGAYKGNLENIFGLFGEDRVIFGSDWPNSDNWASYDEVFGLVKTFFADRSAAAREKYFWKNSVRAYKWKKRHASQPEAVA